MDEMDRAKYYQNSHQMKYGGSNGVKPPRQQRKQLSETCLTEFTLGIWLEIGGEKHTLRSINTQPKPGQKNIIGTCESGFGITREKTWVLIENLNTKIVYEILTKK